MILCTALALCLTQAANADMLTGGTFLQVPTGVNSSVVPEFTLAPTIAARLWMEVRGLKFALEGSTYSTAFDLSDSTKGWGGAAYWKIRTINFGNYGALHVLAKGGMSTTGEWSLDQKQYQVGPVFDFDFDGRKPAHNGTAWELGVYWQSVQNVEVDHVGVQTNLVFDVQ